MVFLVGWCYSFDMESKESFVKKESAKKSPASSCEGVKNESRANLADFSQKSSPVEVGKEKPKKKVKAAPKAVSVEELKKEKVMSKKDAKKEKDSFELAEHKPSSTIEDWVLMATIHEMVLESYLCDLEDKDKKEGKVSKLFGFFFVNVEKKSHTMESGNSLEFYKADMVFYCELDDGEVRRMYLPSDKFISESASVVPGYAACASDAHIAGVDAARKICGFKESSPKSQ